MASDPRRVPFECLDVGGIRGATVILDIDGTITGDRCMEGPAGALATAKELASRNIVYLASNHPDSARNRAVARKIGCECIETPHRKPSKRVIEFLPPHHKAAPRVVIGDKVLIDGLFAFRIGARFVKVAPIRSPGDRTLTKVAYFLDALVSRILDWTQVLRFFNSRISHSG